MTFGVIIVPCVSCSQYYQANPMPPLAAIILISIVGPILLYLIIAQIRDVWKWNRRHHK